MTMSKLEKATFNCCMDMADVSDGLDDFVVGIIDAKNSRLTRFDVVGGVIHWLIREFEAVGFDQMGLKLRNVEAIFERMPTERNTRRITGV